MAEYASLRKIEFELCGGNLPEKYKAFVRRVLNDRNLIPTVDAVPVVRCKDCKHRGWVQEPCHGKSVDYCRVWDCTLRNLETTFCSYGEPKEEPHD